MKCDCITTISEALRKDLEDDRASLDTVLTISSSVMDAYPALTVTYHPKKKDGSYGKEKKISIRPTFCPFCGQKYSV